ncbi:MAG: S8 family serine peptidase [Candidatus Hodarchaeota archaeon]
MRRNLPILLISLTILLLMPVSAQSTGGGWAGASDQALTLNPAKVGPMIHYLLERGAELPVSIMFNHELAKSEISFFEEQGILFRSRGGIPIHIGNVYLTSIPDRDALDILKNSEIVIQIQRADLKLEPALEESIPEIGADEAHQLLDGSGNNLTGKGVRVAIIDTGINWYHPDFYLPDGPQYIIRYDSESGDYYFDKNDNETYDSDEVLRYFDEYNDGGVLGEFDARYDWLWNDEDNNSAYSIATEELYVLNDTNNDGEMNPLEYGVQLTTTKILKIYDQPAGAIYVRGVNLTNPAINLEEDTHGHGTHVAGTIAGGPFGFHNILGVAPEATLLVVKTTFYLSDIIDGISWAVDEGADVISLSLGAYVFTPLDGSSNLDQVVDSATSQNVTVVVAAGNEASDDIHSNFTIPSSGQTQIRFQVSLGLSEFYQTLLWRDTTNNLTVEIKTPSSGIVTIPINGSVILNGHNITGWRYNSTRGTAEFDILIDATGSTETGIWTLYVENQQLSPENVHAYIYPNYAYYLDYVDPYYTLNSPATADTALAVASYVSSLGGSSPTVDDISIFSSRGPRIDEVQKLTLAAPGEYIRSTASYDAGYWPFGSHTPMQGTSMSCPHVSGVVALVLQARPSLTPQAVRDVLTNTARTDEYTGTTPNNIWGYGKVDAYNAALFLDPQITQISADGQPIAVGGTTSYSRGQIFSLVVGVYGLGTPPYGLDVDLFLTYANGTLKETIPLVYNSSSNQWEIQHQFSKSDPVQTYNFTFSAYNATYTSDPKTIYVSAQNNFPTIHEVSMSPFDLFRVQTVWLIINVSDYEDGNNLDVITRFRSPLGTYHNVSAIFNSSSQSFETNYTFGPSSLSGTWAVYVIAQDLDGATGISSLLLLNVQNNLPTIQVSLQSTTIGVGTPISGQVTVNDLEDTFHNMIVRLCLYSSKTGWLNQTILLDGATTDFSVPTDAIPEGIYELYFRILDGDGGETEIAVGTITISAVSQPLLLAVVLVVSMAVIGTFLALKRRS